MVSTLRGKQVLVVEDEYFIAIDLARALERAGADVLGPVGDLRKALSLASDGRLDAAVLDVNLEGEFSYQLADSLKARGVPFVFVTGYDPWSLRADHRHAPHIAKPFTPETIVETVEQICASGSRA